MRAWIAMLVLSAAILQGPKALAQQTYDYQGLLMTGTGGSQDTFTAALTFFGPVTNPATLMNFQFTISGTDVNRSYNLIGCSISYCGGELNPIDVTVNSSGGIFKSANIYMGDGEHGFTGQDGSLVAVVGPKGDSLEIEDFYGHPVLSVANATPGTWTRAPEIDAAPQSPVVA